MMADSALFRETDILKEDGVKLLSSSFCITPPATMNSATAARSRKIMLLIEDWTFFSPATAAPVSGACLTKGSETASGAAGVSGTSGAFTLKEPSYRRQLLCLPQATIIYGYFPGAKPPNRAEKLVAQE
ncbi:hypothetical protein HYU15_04285, partial [Candidatus Woesearchaeota archaeon]|nr:hypothetical protein [Candidatus Woesearchaeota archaeon]